AGFARVAGIVGIDHPSDGQAGVVAVGIDDPHAAERDAVADAALDHVVDDADALAGAADLDAAQRSAHGDGPGNVIVLLAEGAAMHLVLFDEGVVAEEEDAGPTTRDVEHANVAA